MNDYDLILERLQLETAGWPLEQLEARLKQEKEKLWQLVAVEWGGLLAETILSEAVPAPDAFYRLACHEAGHFEVMRQLGHAIACITMERSGGCYCGRVHQTWATVNDPVPPPVDYGFEYDARAAGQVAREAETMGVNICLDDCRGKAEEILRKNWRNVCRIADHVESVCRSKAAGQDWKAIIPAATIQRLFWTPEQWRTEYQIEVEPCAD